MGEYPKAKMPDYGDGPEPCEDCAIKDKRIAELEAVIAEFIYVESEPPKNIPLEIKSAMKAWAKSGKNDVFKFAFEAGQRKSDDMVEEANKRIEELEVTGRELLIDAMNLYSHYPNNFRKTVEEYFSDEIKVFGRPEGVKE